MDSYEVFLTSLLNELIALRDSETKRLIYGKIPNDELHQLIGSIQSFNKIIERIEERIKEALEYSNYPPNVRYLKKQNELLSKTLSTHEQEEKEFEQVLNSIYKDKDLVVKDFTEKLD